MLPFGTEVALTLSGVDGEVHFAGVVRCLLGSGRAAVRLDELSKLRVLRAGQVLSIAYVRAGEAKYEGTTSVWSVDVENSLVVLTPPQTTGRRQDRRFVRVSHPVRVKVTVFDAAGAAAWSGHARAKDVSAGGLCLPLPLDLELGTSLHCSFELPGRAGRVMVDAVAVIVRNDGPTYGVEFVSLGRAVEQQLVAAVSWLLLKPRVGV